MNAGRRPWFEAPRFAPLCGAAIGAVGGAIYWAAALLWPASVAVMLAMIATALLDARMGCTSKPGRGAPATFVFAVLIKYNALMALSAANLPFALPPNLALGFIMMAGHAASRAIAVIPPPLSHAGPSPAQLAPAHLAHADVVIALLLGFAPAALIGIPGLAGVAAAILARIALVSWVMRRGRPMPPAKLGIAQHLTEVCFYLGALATWTFV